MGQEIRRLVAQAIGKNVMNRKNDVRHRSEHFITAPAIFPSNDFKYEVHKQRAQIYAAEKNLANTTPMYESSKTYDRGGNEVVGIKECEQPPLEKYLNLK